MINTAITKKASYEPPFSRHLSLLLAIFTLSTQAEIDLATYVGHNFLKMCKIVNFGSSLSEKQPFTFEHFWTFKNPIELLNL